MNQQFVSYVTSTAFQLTLNAEAIDMLFQLRAYCGVAQGSPEYGLQIANKNVQHYLMRRGLIARSPEPTCVGNWILTRAGRLLLPLLAEAGFRDTHFACLTVEQRDRLMQQHMGLERELGELGVVETPHVPV